MARWHEQVTSILTTTKIDRAETDSTHTNGILPSQRVKMIAKQRLLIEDKQKTKSLHCFGLDEELKSLLEWHQNISPIRSRRCCLDEIYQRKIRPPYVHSNANHGYAILRNYISRTGV